MQPHTASCRQQCAEFAAHPEGEKGGGQVPVKVGADSRDIGAIAGDIHAASLVGCVERHVDRVQEQVSNGEHIICDVEGRPVLDADTGLNGVHSASQPAGSVALQ